MGPPVLCRRFLVSGQVQGVGFRAATQVTGCRLGLHGFVRNLADGRVEVVGCGPLPALANLESWLRHGPRGARVGAVCVERAPDMPVVTPEFVIR